MKNGKSENWRTSLMCLAIILISTSSCSRQADSEKEKSGIEREITRQSTMKNGAVVQVTMQSKALDVASPYSRESFWGGENSLQVRLVSRMEVAVKGVARFLPISAYGDMA